MKTAAAPFRRRRPCAAALAVALCVMQLGWPLSVQAQVRLPSLGETASQDLSIGAERHIGDEIMREVRRDPAFLDDPVLQDYLESVFRPLVESASRLGNIDADTDHAFAWQPFLVRDSEVNAFAWPGGYIGVNLGMIAITGSTDELASVLAHELSHVTQRHIARSIAPQAHASMASIAAMLAGLVLAARTNNADVANAAIVGSQGAAIQSQINGTRATESEADRVGFSVLKEAGYAPSSMASMFEKLETAMRLNDFGDYPFLRDHPLTSERIAEARNRVLLSNSAPAVPTLEHALMAARARVLMADGNDALSHLRAGNRSPLRPAAAVAPDLSAVARLYTEAMADSLLDDPGAAQRNADEALRLAMEIKPVEPRALRSLGMLQAQVRLAAHHPAEALQALDALPPITASDTPRPALLLRAQAMLDLQRQNPEASTAALRESAETLQTWLADRPDDAAAWDLLASTTGALGLKLRSMRAAAEAQAALGDLQGAIDRLRAAQLASRSTQGQDFIEASVIDARMRQLMAQRRQFALEARQEGRDPSSQ